MSGAPEHESQEHAVNNARLPQGENCDCEKAAESKWKARLREKQKRKETVEDTHLLENIQPGMREGRRCLEWQEVFVKSSEDRPTKGTSPAEAAFSLTSKEA